MKREGYLFHSLFNYFCLFVSLLGRVCKIVLIVVYQPLDQQV